MTVVARRARLLSMGFYDTNRVGAPDDDVELDLTNSHLPNLDDVEIKGTLEVS